jgi:hypothetical protein
VENVKPERDLCVFVRNRRLKRAGSTESSGKLTVTSGW